MRLDRKVELEAVHWWYRGRRAVLAGVLRRLEAGSRRAVLDAGCGTGHNLELLAPLGPVTGVEINPAAVAIARRRGMKAHAAGLEALPFPAERFDLIGCFDVLEHVADDLAALRELHRVARPGAVLALTVPAYPGLFAEHDRAAGHLRRYRAQTIAGLLAVSGWRARIVSHFNTLLLAPAALHRRLRSSGSGRPKSDLLRTPKSDLLRTPRALDSVLSWPMRFEARLIESGLDLPAGLSIVVGADKV